METIKRRLLIYCIALLSISIFIFINFTILERDPWILLAWPLLTSIHDFRLWLSWGVVIALMILVRVIFSPIPKYRVMYIVTLFVLFVVISLSVTLKFNGIRGLLSFYYGFPRYWVYLPMTIFTGILVWALSTFTKKLSPKIIKVLFWFVDILYTPIFFFALFVSYFGGQ